MFGTARAGLTGIVKIDWRVGFEGRVRRTREHCWILC